jgi:long-chain acyl-CoA synthetase
MSIVSEIYGSCRRGGKRTAVAQGSNAISYEELGIEIRRFAQMAGGCEGEGIVIQGRNDIQTIVALYGTLAASAIPVLTDATWPTELLQRICDRYGIAFSQNPNGFNLISTRIRASNRFAGRYPGSALVRFTSGSTDLPKAMGFADQAVCNAGHRWKSAAKLTENDVVICAAAVNNGLAFNTSLLPLFSAGGTLVLEEPGTLPSAFARSARDRCATVWIAFPFFLRLFFDRCRRLANIEPAPRLVVSSAAPLDDELAATILSKLGPSALCNYYGIAECGPCTAGQKRNGVGAALPGVEIKIIDDQGVEIRGEGEPGKVRVKSDSMPIGYLREGSGYSPLADAEGFFRTDDIGCWTNDAGLRIVGRSGNILNIAGRKIDTIAVEMSLRRIEGVHDAHVYRDSRQRDDSFSADVVHSGGTSSDIVAEMQRMVPEYMIPSRIHLVKKILRGSSGKKLRLSASEGTSL